MRRLVALALLLSCLAPLEAHALAPEKVCEVTGGYQHAQATCWVEGEREDGLPTQVGSGPPLTYEPTCGSSGQYVCFGNSPCSELGSDGEVYEGIVYDVVQGGQTVGQTCVTDAPGEPSAPPQVTPAMVVRAFQRISWPASALTIQPPGGRTAVNFETFFFTDDTAPVTQTVTLLGQRVTIEATPSEFTWRYGDGTAETTASPGDAYPQGDVTHLYLRKGGVAPRLDTTYTGRYRVGSGPWIGIPASHTVAGAPQTLDVVEIDLKLVYEQQR